MKASLLDNYSAGDADLASMPGYLCVTGLNPIKLTDFAGYQQQNAVAETVQIYTIGGTTVPTIVAGQQYRFFMGNAAQKTESANNEPRAIGATAPAVLTGTPATDRHNLYVDLARKINSDATLRATAYPVLSIAHAAGAFVVGEILTGATSGATGIVISDAANVVTVGLIGSTLFLNGENLDDESGSGPFAATAGPTLGLGLRIVDNGNYYYQGNQGANTIVISKGFTAAMLVQTQAPVYWEGLGTRMAEQVPVQETTSGNLASGTLEFPTNNPPTAGASYRRLTLFYRPVKHIGAGSGNEARELVAQRVWVNQADGDLAAFTAVIAGLTVYQ